jgi:hypothetical protein
VPGVGGTLHNTSSPGGLPFALATGDKDGVTRLVGEAIERALGYHIAPAQLADARARIG